MGVFSQAEPPPENVIAETRERREKKRQNCKIIFSPFSAVFSALSRLGDDIFCFVIKQRTMPSAELHEKIRLLDGCQSDASGKSGEISARRFDLQIVFARRRGKKDVFAFRFFT